MTTIILSAAKLAGVSPSLLLAMCTVESGLDPNAVNLHDKGQSTGLCQVKVIACKQVGMKVTEAELLNPRTNAKCAAKYLSYQIKRYNGNIVQGVTAYNAGRDTGSLKYFNKVMGKLK